MVLPGSFLCAVVPRTQNVVPRTQDVAPRTQDVVPRTQDVAQRTQNVVPRTQKVVHRPLNSAEKPAIPKLIFPRGVKQNITVHVSLVPSFPHSAATTVHN